MSLPADFLLPDYGGADLGVVLPAAVGALGLELDVADGEEPPGHRDAEAARAALDLPAVDAVCVVLVDGLGRHMLLERGGHAPFLRSVLPSARTLTSGFPSTTATSLTLLGTSAPPGATGMLGYSLRDPATGELTNMITWGGRAVPEDWQRCPTTFERLAAQGVRALSLGAETFRGSGLTRAALRGGDFASATDLDERVDLAVRALRSRSRCLVYLYWGDVDTIGHHRGWQSWEWGDAVEAVDRALARLARSLPRRTALLVTADHGMVDVPRDLRVDVAAHPRLTQGVEMVSGEPRAVHVHCASGQAEAVAARWGEVLGERAWVLTRDEAQDAGLFGPLADRHRAVVGDVVVACRGRHAVVDSRVQSPASLGLIGMHGSLTPAELEVPLVVVTG